MAISKKSSSSRRGSASARAVGPQDAARAKGGLSLLDEDGDIVHEASPQVTESLRYMLARLRIGDGSELPERVGITSAVSGEGVTYICRSLALVLNNDANKRVCVVDLNWSSPSQWPDDGRPGVAQVLEGVASLDDVLVPSGNAGLTFLPSGTTSVFDRPLLANNPRLDKVFLELADNFDHVLLDLPAVQATSEALTLAERAGAVAVVVSQGVAPESQVRDALDELHGVKVLGVILNRASSRVPAVIRRLLPGA